MKEFLRFILILIVVTALLVGLLVLTVKYTDKKSNEPQKEPISVGLPVPVDVIEKVSTASLTVSEAIQLKDEARKQGKVKKVVAELLKKVKNETINHEELKTFLALAGPQTIRNFSGNPDDIIQEIK